ncbi:MAG TPA: beta-ketoacyl-ACP synthase 3 [Candidatus Nitrosopolaris sp.]|nr:beta-ketoacyl-ACP synthase 3 [Candidatus Nitrosopolaris sp.]
MANQTPVLGVEIAGWGGALPAESLTNDELIARYSLDSSDAWIRERTGIERRSICSEDENLVALATDAGRRALESTGLTPPRTIDKLFLGSTTPYRDVPGSHPAITRALGELGYSFTSSKESNTACTGFVTSLLDGYRSFAVDGIDSALVIGADTLSSITDYTDRSTAILFADGAGAVAMQRTDRDSGLLGWHEETDGTVEEILFCERGGSIQMDGQEVFKRAVKVMIKAGEIALEKSETDVEALALTVPHQANLRIIELAGRKLGIPLHRMAVTINKHGNTSSASIPLALAEAADAGRIARGAKIMMVGFGAGMTAAAAVIEW